MMTPAKFKQKLAEAEKAPTKSFVYSEKDLTSFEDLR
jgi:hypothetical protein